MTREELDKLIESGSPWSPISKDTYTEYLSMNVREEFNIYRKDVLLTDDPDHFSMQVWVKEHQYLTPTHYMRATLPDQLMAEIKKLREANEVMKEGLDEYQCLETCNAFKFKDGSCEMGENCGEFARIALSKVEAIMGVQDE